MKDTLRKLRIKNFDQYDERGEPVFFFDLPPSHFWCFIEETHKQKLNYHNLKSFKTREKTRHTSLSCISYVGIWLSKSRTFELCSNTITYSSTITPFHQIRTAEPAKYAMARGKNTDWKRCNKMAPLNDSIFYLFPCFRLEILSMELLGATVSFISHQELLMVSFMLPSSFAHALCDPYGAQD